MKAKLLRIETQSVSKWKTKIKSLLFVSFILLSIDSSAQLISTYTFTTATGTTADAMSSPTITLVGSNNDDSVSALTNFTSLTGGSGFTFLFDGTPYTSFSVSSNGLLQLGARIASVDSANSLAIASFISRSPKKTASAA